MQRVLLRRALLRLALSAAAVCSFSAVPGEIRAQVASALVIGNSDYASARLGAAARDARQVADALTRSGVRVEVKENLNLQQLRDSLAAYARRVPTQSTAAVYFAGYSMTGEWKDKSGKTRQANYLVPLKPNVNKVSEIRRRCLALPEVLRTLNEQAGSRRAVVLIDAVREYPQRPDDAGEWRGLLEPAQQPADALVAFGAAPGELASGEYAERLASALAASRGRGLFAQLREAAAKSGWVSAAVNGAPPVVYSPRQRVAASVDGASAPGQHYVNGIGQVYCWCPPGKFLMGSPPDEPNRSYDEEQAEVTLSRGFWISKFEVTEREYRLATKRSSRAPHGKNHPLLDTRSGDARRFADNLTKQERAAGRLPSDWTYALPTEAEWEYACRAGSSAAYSFGAAAEDLPRHGNFADKTLFAENESDYRYASRHWNDGHARTAPVGSYLPNAWGLHDMHGNVWEWCADAYAPTLSGGVDPSGPEKGAERGRVIRGGSWLSYAHYCRSAMRQSHHDLTAAPYLGIRIVLKRAK